MTLDRKIWLALLAVGCLIAAATARAQTRSLAWPTVTITAHLDSTGALRIQETQTIRLSGDWNGAERTYPRSFSQSFTLHRLSRLDPASGTWLDLTADSELDDVDDFDWVNDGTTLRWRARLPNDPPFDNAERTYRIEATYDRILVRQSDGRFLLDHNFAMVDREGPIERFELTLTIDPAWQTPTDFTGHWVLGPLQPGEGWLVSMPLTYGAAGRPSSVRYGAATTERQLILGVLLVGVLALLIKLILREHALGRFASIPPRSDITRGWIETHVTSMLPEVAGAAWDDHTSAPEVAAILARLVQEGKLESQVTTEKIWMFSRENLHLTLKIPRKEFEPHERALIDALFESHSTTTSTDDVRTRYKSTGFDPASTVRKPLKGILDEAAPGGAKPSWKPTGLLVLAALTLIILGAMRDIADLPVALATGGIAFAIFIFGTIIAVVVQRAAGGFGVALLFLLVPIIAMVVPFAKVLLLDARFVAGGLTLAGLATWILAITNSLCNSASSRHSPQRIAMRQRLFAARRFFADELRKPNPALLDLWYPYVIAFGLGRAADKWFRAFGGDVARVASVGATSSSFGGGSSSGGNSWSGFGGGGGFAGAGVSASFAAAVGGMAASVPSPSSSSGGGGSSSGGGSSGGGGGGGW